MAAADLVGPLEDFFRRTCEIKAIVVAMEVATKSSGVLVSGRSDVDLSKIGGQTINTANAMSLIFLASSFEEFIREEMTQCAGYLSDRYHRFAENNRHKVREAYWKALLERLRYARSILTRKTPKVPDVVSIGKVRALLGAAQGFVVDDDPMHMDASVFSQHSNNMRPSVVNDLWHRIGIKEILNSAAESSKIKTYFGVTKRVDAAEKLAAKLDEFYDRRNELVHSLSSASGYAVNYVLDYVEMFELVSEAIKNVLEKELASW